MDQELLGLRQHVVAVERHLARMAEVLHELRGLGVEADVAEQPDLEHAGEDVARHRLAAADLARVEPVVLVGEHGELGARDHVAADQPEQDLAVEVRQMRRHLGDVALGDHRGAARDLLAHGLARPPRRIDRREVAADEHDVARPAEGVAQPERRRPSSSSPVTLMHDPRRVPPPRKRTQGSRAPGSARLRLRSTSMFLRMISIRSSRT